MLSVCTALVKNEATTVLPVSLQTADWIVQIGVVWGTYGSLKATGNVTIR